MEQLITCPKCKHEFELEKALLLKLEDRVREETAEEARSKAKREFEAEKAALDLEKADLAEQLSEARQQATDFREKELGFLKKQRELEAKAKDVELQVEREVSEKRKEIENEVRTSLLEDHQQKERQYEEKIRQMKAQAEELQRRIEQGSQEVQGEAAEATLEELLAGAFPSDTVVPVPKGMRGADVLHHVLMPGGRVAGTIIWESKRVKNWSKDWVTKLKRDQLTAKADLAVIASRVLPDGVDRFALHDGVWVTDFRSARGLATSLRGGLLQAARIRISATGKSEKMESQQ